MSPADHTQSMLVYIGVTDATDKMTIIIAVPVLGVIIIVILILIIIVSVMLIKSKVDLANSYAFSYLEPEVVTIDPL